MRIKAQECEEQSIIHEPTDQLYMATLQAGHLYLTGTLSDDAGRELLMGLHYLELHPPEKGIVRLHINSEGGSLTTTFQFINAMMVSKLSIHTYASGIALSAACMILMAGAKGHRYAYHNAGLMMHELSTSPGPDGFTNQMEFARFSKHLKAAMIDLAWHQCNLATRREVSTLLITPKDIWMTPKEAKKFGVIDHIICRKNRKRKS